MKKTFLAVLAVFSFVALLPAQDKTLSDEDKERGWVSIFDGKSLDGWKANEPYEGWIIEDGAITGVGKRNHLYYMEELGDFELKIDCKINKGGNSGLYFHSPWVDNAWPKEGFELQINSSHGDPVKTASLYNIIKLLKAPHNDDEWFTYYITVKGDTLTVRVDDEVIYIYVDPVEKAEKAQAIPQPEPITEATKRIRQKGYIALQQHDPTAKPQFKNIFLRVIQ